MARQKRMKYKKERRLCRSARGTYYSVIKHEQRTWSTHILQQIDNNDDWEAQQNEEEWFSSHDEEVIIILQIWVNGI